MWVIERTFKRRFAAATGLTPIAYVQRLRIEEAKRRLERTDAAVDEISWRVGYEDPAFFRRLFRRVTGMAPGAYRRRFRIATAASLLLRRLELWGPHRGVLQTCERWQGVAWSRPGASGLRRRAPLASSPMPRPPSQPTSPDVPKPIAAG